ncbi:MAG TPA: RNase adapter RapZ [Candidatus Limnocylindrales bacterium]|nr:RNase adapter RapZ [Candidatus Limnocylindrales bacterium]
MTARKGVPAKKKRSVRREPVARAGKPELVIITGLSGSGKGSVLKALEDLGFYAVDNLPLELIPKFAELTRDHSSIRCAALVVDIREGKSLKNFPEILARLRKSANAKVIFLEADDQALVRRFSETRRPHPLGSGESVLKSIRAERRQLAPIRDVADLVLNTSKFTVHELREVIGERFSGQRDESKILIYVTSFGYRAGVPTDSDLVFDVRFLPNPNYIPKFKNLTGRNPAVAHYIRSFPQTAEFIQRITDLLNYLLPHYIREGKSYLTISFGCTGGQHRSVMMADQIRKNLVDAGYKAKVNHRDILKHTQ